LNKFIFLLKQTPKRYYYFSLP